MKELLHSATLKLTLIYIAILMVVSVSFSVVLYRVSTAELERGIPIRGQFGELFISSGPFDAWRQARIRESRDRLTRQLVLVNLVTLGVGGAASYFLARRTLQPIQEAMDNQSRFTSDASHELRTPLTTLQTELEVALRNPNLTKNEMRTLLSSNLEEVVKLHSLTDRLLQLSNGHDIVMKPVNVEQSAIDSVGRVVALAQAKNISIENSVRSAMVNGDTTSLTDLLVILLENAIKYSPENSAVRLSSKTVGKTVQISVVDRGIGIETEDIEHIFDRFYRADTSRSSQNVGGYGLGLSIAKKIVAQHKGHINVTSRPGKGTTFTVEIPTVSAESQ